MKVIAVVQEQKLWECARDEVLVGVTAADQAFLSRLRERVFPTLWFSRQPLSGWRFFSLTSNTK
jgi:hypothetical protein